MIARSSEIAILREGGKRLGRILQELAGMVAPGLSTQALEDKTRELIAAGGDAPAFLQYKPDPRGKPYPSALCVSINDVMVHGVPNITPRTIQSGDIVSLDCGIKHGGFFTDSAVTVIAGAASPEDEKLVRGAYEALTLGIAQARLGNTLGDIGHAIEEVARTYGFGFPRTLCGHGVGRAVHEEPHVMNFGAPGTGAKLQEGLVIAIEPMFTRGKGEVVLDADGFSYRTKDSSRAAHAEHTVLITKNGPEILTAA